MKEAEAWSLFQTDLAEKAYLTPEAQIMINKQLGKECVEEQSTPKQ